MKKLILHVPTGEHMDPIIVRYALSMMLANLDESVMSDIDPGDTMNEDEIERAIQTELDRFECEEQTYS